MFSDWGKEMKQEKYNVEIWKFSHGAKESESEIKWKKYTVETGEVQCKTWKFSHGDKVERNINLK